jgi:hypothetical protein
MFASEYPGKTSVEKSIFHRVFRGDVVLECKKQIQENESKSNHLKKVVMKKNIVFKPMLSAFFLLVVMAACEKDEMIPGPEVNDEAKSATLTDQSKITNDDALALEMMNLQIEPVSAVNDLVKYEYHGTRPAKLNYYKRPVNTTTDAVSALKLVQTDEFTYDKNERLSSLSRVNYNVTTAAVKVSPTILKKYVFDRSGRISEIFITKSDVSSNSMRHEYLKYNEAGQMVKKSVEGLDISFSYEYDKNGDLVRELEYHRNLVTKITLFFYTPEGNVMYKQFLWPLSAVSNTTDFRGGIVKYEYEPGPNPFKWMKVPYGTLFESMDELSNHNYIRIATPWKEVRYKYEYSMLTGFPLVRYTIE